MSPWKGPRPCTTCPRNLNEKILSDSSADEYPTKTGVDDELDRVQMAMRAVLERKKAKPDRPVTKKLLGRLESAQKNFLKKLSK